MNVAENHGVYVHEPCTNDIYSCDCDDCRDERELERARRYDTDGETL
jgi:hypothetical protein